ncbi:MAG: hypothetical protein ACREXR_02570 [Gammaproteobacteria bacterium]
MEAIDCVQILLKEYDTLRAEILLRIAHRFAFLGLTGAAGGYVFFTLKYKDLAIYQIIVLIIAALAVLVAWFWQGQVIARCSERIAEIEVAVNSLAGAELLVWEHEKRGSVLFHKMHK